MPVGIDRYTVMGVPSEFARVIAVRPVVSVWYAWWVNRPKAILQSAAAVPGTTVVTVPEIAHATPETNIVSATTNVVVPSPPGTTAADLNQAELRRNR